MQQSSCDVINLWLCLSEREDTHEDDVEDPEYNFQEEEEENDLDSWDLRNDPAVMITRKHRLQCLWVLLIFLRVSVRALTLKIRVMGVWRGFTTLARNSGIFIFHQLAPFLGNVVLLEYEAS